MRPLISQVAETDIAEIPAGKFDDGDVSTEYVHHLLQYSVTINLLTPRTTAARELQEETGLVCAVITIAMEGEWVSRLQISADVPA